MAHFLSLISVISIGWRGPTPITFIYYIHKKGATIGANATIVCGTTLGRYAFIGAGAVITKDVPDHALMVGNPAKHIGWMCECGERLDDKLKCTVCGKVYQKNDKGLRGLRT